MSEKDKTEKPEKKIPKWRQCPLCWGNYKGVGKVRSTQGMRRYYKCCECGFSWSVDLGIRTISATMPAFDD